MSIDVNNESGTEVDEQAILDIARYALARMRIHPLSELSVDRRGRRRHGAAPHPVDGPARAHRRACPSRWTSCGRRPKDDDEPPQGLLGDIVLCPEVAERQGEEAGHSTPWTRSCSS